MINLELYRYFYVVAQTGNITKASEVLNISQPAVTKQIKNLESLLNTTLFTRTKKGVILTEAGESIFLNVKKALTLLNENQEIVSEFSSLNKGTIRIGISTTLMRKYLLKYIEEFHNRYPNIVVDIYTDPTKDMITKLKNGMIDIIIGKISSLNDSELSFTKLDSTRYVFVANKKYFDIKKLNACDLENYPILLQEYPSDSRNSAQRYFENNNINIVPKMNIASSNLLIDFIKMGYGIGYATELYVKEEIENGNLYSIDVSPKPDEINFGIIQLKNNVLPIQCRKFIELLIKK